MDKKHYNLIIEKTKHLKGFVDGDDISDIIWNIEELDEPSENLLCELYNIQNAMLCVHGMDYGKSQNWDDVVLNILNEFKGGYESNENNLDKLLSLIKPNI